MFIIEDKVHCQKQGTYATFEDAIAELRHRATIPHDEPPNKAPCKSWRTCRREYKVIEYETSQIPWRPLRQAMVLHVSAAGPRWSDTYEWKSFAPDPSRSNQ